MTELALQETMSMSVEAVQEPDHDVEVDFLLSQFNVYKEDMRRREVVQNKRISDCERVVLGLTVCCMALATMVFGFMVSR